MRNLAEQPSQNLFTEDPEIEARIHDGIETHRKGFGEIKLVDHKGNPVAKASVQLVQTKHEYHFGGNLFMLGEFGTDEQNVAYETAFKGIFNLGVIPFYWADLEPHDGILRFDKNSTPIHRRPPPDRCLEFCEANAITPQGHPLLWHGCFPSWLHGTKKEVESRIARHLQEIAARYSGRIHRWDVVNEARPWSPEQGPIPDAFIDLAFKLAGQFFPAATLAYLSRYSEENRCFHHMIYSPVYLLVRRLLDHGINVNAIGFQFQLLQSELEHADRFMCPMHLHYLFKGLDNYARLGLPLDLSEINVSFKHDVKDGDELQSLIVEKLYKLWFSHPSTQGAIWGNLVDSAIEGTDTDEGGGHLRAGLLNGDFTPKKAFTTLKRLITEEWTTRTTLDYQAAAVNKFRGFYGDYDVLIETASGTHSTHLKLAKGERNQYTLTLPVK